MGMYKLGLAIPAVAALALASGCTESVPLQVAGSPAYERGIDQDISAGHDGGSATLDNVGPGAHARQLLDR